VSDYSIRVFPLDPDMPKLEWAKLHGALFGSEITGHKFTFAFVHI
jgi:hypothetical protein